MGVAAAKEERISSSAVFLLTTGAVFAITALVFAPVVRAQLLRRYEPTQYDSPVGVPISLPREDLRGHDIDAESQLLLVYVGNCGQCTVDSIAKRTWSRSRFKQVLLLAFTTPDKALATYPDSDKVRLIADPSGRIVSELGAMQSPRYYIVQAGHLLSIWKDVETAPAEWLGESH